MKLYILARKDAPIGKIMAHVGHVSVGITFGEDLEIFNEKIQTKIILEIEKDKKVLIVAQLDVIKKIKKLLKVILKRRNINTVNAVSTEYYYNIEGINKYQT